MVSAYLGYALLGIGIAILVITLLLGYGIYQNETTQSIFQSTSAVSGSNLTAVVGNTLANYLSPLNSSIYTIIAIIVLFLFATIGYKLALLGVNILNSPQKANK